MSEDKRLNDVIELQNTIGSLLHTMEAFIAEYTRETTEHDTAQK